MKRDRVADRQTYNGHRDSMIESTQWADSMKKDFKLQGLEELIFMKSETCFQPMSVWGKCKGCQDSLYQLTHSVAWGKKQGQKGNAPDDISGGYID